MVRISGVVINPNKHLGIALQDIYGIGKSISSKICFDINLDFNTKVSKIGDDIILKIQNYINGIEVEGDLRRRVSINIKRLKDIKCYRGIRHRVGLPVRGQRTKTNAKTRKKRRERVFSTKR